MRRICRSHGARSAAPPLQLCPPADTASASFAISSRKSSAVRSTLHSHLAGFAAKSRFPSRPGDPKKPGRVVKIEMFEGSGKVDYEPARIEVRRGEQIRFVLQNDGEEDHEFILATARENRKHAEIMKKKSRNGARRSKRKTRSAAPERRDRLEVHEARHIRVRLSHSWSL